MEMQISGEVFGCKVIIMGKCIFCRMAPFNRMKISGVWGYRLVINSFGETRVLCLNYEMKKNMRKEMLSYGNAVLGFY